MNSSHMFEKLDKEINYLFFRKYRFKRQVRHHLKRFYSPDAPKGNNKEKYVIFMADGKVRHGGLGDRLRGIISLFRLCLDKGYDFRIHFVSPFRLEKYLVPNEYDWRIGDEEMSYNCYWSLPVYNDTRRENDDREKAWQRKVLSGQISQDYMQIHSYNTFFFAENEFKSLFHKLFKPSPEVAECVNEVKGNLSVRYISISTRFIELLGDFKEPKNIWHTLDDENAQRLMASCRKEIQNLLALPENKGMKALVTSDSNRFLEYMSDEPDVYIIPGHIAHMDTKGIDNNDQLKTFVDFYSIMGAVRSYLLVGDGMYRSSNFSKRAAQADGRNIIVIDIESAS